MSKFKQATPEQVEIIRAASMCPQLFNAWENNFIADRFHYGETATLSNQQAEVIDQLAVKLQQMQRYFLITYRVDKDGVFWGNLPMVETGYPAHPTSRMVKLNIGDKHKCGFDQICITQIIEFKSRQDFITWAQ